NQMLRVNPHTSAGNHPPDTIVSSRDRPELSIRKQSVEQVNGRRQGLACAFSANFIGDAPSLPCLDEQRGFLRHEDHPAIHTCILLAVYLNSSWNAIVEAPPGLGSGCLRGEAQPEVGHTAGTRPAVGCTGGKPRR